MNVLFVCKANLQRSPTAENILCGLAKGDVEVKSAGITQGARTRVDHELIQWADRIYVMTDEIRRRMKHEFSRELENKEIEVLGILDQYLKGEELLKRRLLEEFYRDDFLSRYLDEETLQRLGVKEKELS